MSFRPNILYEDNHLLVVNKPAGLLSQADRSGDADLLSLLKDDIKHRYDKPGRVFLGLVHRLDRPVGGVMVFAKTSKAASRLSRQMREQALQKEYVAVVHGRILKKEEELIEDLQKDPKTNRSKVVCSGSGKTARLTYRRLDYHAQRDLTLLQVCLGSGRGHQIRVQLAHAGHPILGDHRYGRGREGSEPTQPALFACRLGLVHPTRQDFMSFTAWPPQEDPWSIFTTELISLQSS